VLSKAEITLDKNYTSLGRDPSTPETYNGSIILCFDNPEKAKIAAEFLNGYKLDKNHIISAYSCPDFDEIFKGKNEFQEPKILPKSELLSWCVDDKFRD